MASDSKDSSASKARKKKPGKNKQPHKPSTGVPLPVIIPVISPPSRSGGI
jgi:hypothetical protein